jgi:hypothetical protein
MKRVVCLIALAPLLLATTPGDIGGCGEEVKDLDQVAFAKERKNLDCQRCQDCVLWTRRCDVACDEAKQPSALPTTCRPLERDGQVCIRALEDATCAEYATFVSDGAPLTPSECEFCVGATP